MNDPSWLTARPIAHRGFHDMNGERWENTLAAFVSAAEHGYTIECDVHPSSDGVPVVFHDEDLKRVTDREGKLRQRTAADLAGLHIGGTTERIPTLPQVLETVAGRVPMIIELKGVAEHDERLVPGVLECLSTYRGEAALMSFDHRIIRELGRTAEDLPIGLTACGQSDPEIEAHFSMLAHGLSFVSYAIADLPNPFVSFLRERLRMPIITWTVREQSDVEKTYQHGDQMTFEGFTP
ncbi:glycerophosphodiester phosphodiesterase [Chelativorans sp. YIM 93263]|uniref:glycerophosphodiester phosphodiesterase n=1 Tax=Chelativorans sp. YIM 93263 TaxID=2906648 RepID=UPI0023783303|nr:glycerophosphodiester phosphodiesterase [Chelativorans sp. YIM 93263]